MLLLVVDLTCLCFCSAFNISMLLVVHLTCLCCCLSCIQGVYVVHVLRSPFFVCLPACLTITICPGSKSTHIFGFCLETLVTLMLLTRIYDFIDKVDNYISTLSAFTYINTSNALYILKTPWFSVDP